MQAYAQYPGDAHVIKQVVAQVLAKEYSAHMEVDSECWVWVVFPSDKELSWFKLRWS